MLQATELSFGLCWISTPAHKNKTPRGAGAQPMQGHFTEKCNFSGSAQHLHGLNVNLR